MFGIKTALKKFFPLREVTFRGYIEEFRKVVGDFSKAQMATDLIRQENLLLKTLLYSPENHKRIIFIGNHSFENIGDMAISFAQKCFLQSQIKDCTYYQVRTIDYMHHQSEFMNIIRPNDIILLMGGGNFGDIYQQAEDMRRSVILNFPANRIILLPQTYYFSDTKRGKEEEAKTLSIYNRHKNLHLFAREKVSFEMMKQKFPRVPVFLAPDMALSCDLGYPQIRLNVSLCLRSDLESIFSEKDKAQIRCTLLKIAQIEEISMLTPGNKPVPMGEQAAVVEEKIQLFRKSRLVVTDRLHGMILSAATGTPCIVFDNYNHKVRSFYETWLKDGFENIRLVNNMQEFEETAVQWLKKAPESGCVESLQSKYDPLLNLLR